MSRKRHFIVLTAAMATVAWAAACGDGATEPPLPDPPRATMVTVTPATAELTALGATEQLTAEVRDQNGQVMAGATVTWASSGAAVATVSAAGLVTAAGNGTATIRPPFPAEEVEEHRGRDPVAPPGPLAFRGRHLFTVDFKKPSQRERLGLGLRLAVGLMDREARGGLVGLPLRASPIAVLQRPAQPATVLPPLDLEQAGLRIRKHPDPVTAPFASAVAAPASFRACHHSIPIDDGRYLRQTDWRFGRVRSFRESGQQPGVNLPRWSFPIVELGAVNCSRCSTRIWTRRHLPATNKEEHSCPWRAARS